MTRTITARAVLASTAGLALTLALAAPSAARTEVDHYENLVGYLFDNVDAPHEGTSELESDLVAVVNGRLDGFCADAPPDTTRAMARIKDAAVIDIHERSTRANIEVYDGGGLDVITWAFTEYCPALEAGEAPDPIATGTGNLEIRGTIDATDFPAEEIVDVTATARGTVVTGDGERWAVRMIEDLTITARYPDEPGPPLSVDVDVHYFGIDVLNGR